MKSSIDAKAHTKGAIKQAHFGIKGDVTKTDYMLDHALKSTQVSDANPSHARRAPHRPHRAWQQAWGQCMGAGMEAGMGAGRGRGRAADRPRPPACRLCATQVNGPATLMAPPLHASAHHGALPCMQVNGPATLMAPKPSAHVGIGVKLPLDEKLLQTTKDQQAAIAEASTATPLPVPHLEADSFLSAHMKHAAALAFEAHQQELPRSKGGVYPLAPAHEEGMVTPRREVDDAPVTPASVVVSQLRAEPPPPEVQPPPPVLQLW